MPPKKPARNSFFFFMLDYKNRQEARGVVFQGGLKDVANACSAEWENMTPQQKGPYEARAKDAKVKDGISGTKYTSQGVPISLIEREAKRKQDFEDNMNDYIKVTVNMSEHRDNLISKKFYFIHVNWLCRQVLPNGEGDFLPLEFAVTEFSLKNGVQNTYHELIDIDVPMGYTFEARLHAQETHKIDQNPAGGQSNFGAMFQKLKTLLKPETIGEEFPPLYTTKGVMEIVPGLLSRMAKAAGRSVDIFKVYPIETLFFHIRNAAVSNNEAQSSAMGFPAESLAEKEIWKDRFDQALGIACDYHTELDESSIHCSRSIVIRWAYIICDFCCLDLEIEMKPGRHCPLNTDVDGIQKAKETLVREALTYTRTEGARGLSSMTGVTEEHRVRTSERTYREEQERRKHSQPLQIIDHSKLRNSNTQEVKIAPKPTGSRVSTYADLTNNKRERELRMPHTKSYAVMGRGTETVPNMDDMNFPAIGGRGAGLMRNLDNFAPIGRGRGLPFGN